MLIDDLRNYLGTFSVAELIDRVSEFRRLNMRRMTSEEVSRAVRKVFLGEHASAVFPVAIKTYPAGTTFFRVRQPNGSGSTIPMDCLKLEGDAWEPPAHVVRASRLNKAGEPHLYTTPMNMHVAMEEARLKNSYPAAIFVYRATREIKVSSIGDRFESENRLSEDEAVRVNLLADFLRDEFTRDSGPENEHIYRISETIAKEWYDLPPRDVQDAWCYPSVVSKPQVNVCFRPELGHECLAFIGALVGNRQNDDFSIKLIATLSDGRFCYHHLGSSEQMAAFPEISVRQ